MTIEEQLMAAIREENAGLVFKILRGSQINFECDDFKKSHPLLKAVELSNLSIVRLLVEHGASYNCTAEDWQGGTTAFELSVNYDLAEIVDYFLTLNPSESEIAGALSGQGDNEEIFDSLLSRITDVNRKYDDIGYTLLMTVAEWIDIRGNTSETGILRIQKLLDAGANKEITDNEGRTAYNWSENPEIKNMLATSERVLPKPIATNPNNERNEYSRTPNTPLQANEVDKLGCLLGGICYLVPLIGLVLFISWKDTNPNKAKSAGMWALVGFIIGILYWSAI